MKKSTCFIFLILLFSFSFEACRQSPKITTQEVETDTTENVQGLALTPKDIKEIRKAFDKLCSQNTPRDRRQKKDTGIEVDYACAERCFKNYDKIIREGGYLHRKFSVDSANKKPKPKLKNFRLMTTAELFSGTDFACWLYQQHALADASGDTLETTIELGFYDKEFFDCLERNRISIPDSICQKKLGRMSMFVVLRKISKGTKRIDKKVYDFGGLQP